MISPKTVHATGFAIAVALAYAHAPAAIAEVSAASRLDSGGMDVSFGPGPGRLCYESALSGAASDTALETCDAALDGPQSRADRVATYVNRAIVRDARGDYTGALEDLEAALERVTSRPEPYVDMGIVYVHLGRWRDAEQALSKGIELGAPTPQRAYFARAIAREELGDVKGAYNDYMRASELAPDWGLPDRELRRFRVETVETPQAE